MLRLFKIENRIMGMILMLLLFCSSSWAAKDVDSKKTLAILQLDFANKPESMQRTLLRSMALLNTNEALPFFVGVAIDEKYSEEIQREALKGILAIDSKKYRSVLDPLQTSPLDQAQVIRTLQVFDGDFLISYLSSLSFKEEQKIIDMKISAVLKYWKKDQIEKFDYTTWPKDKASENLIRLIQTTKRNSQRTHLVELWSYIYDDRSIMNMSKLLYSGDADLRKKVIYAFRKINSERTRIALKKYLPKATAEEKKWIKDIVNSKQGDDLAK